MQHKSVHIPFKILFSSAWGEAILMGAQLAKNRATVIQQLPLEPKSERAFKRIQHLFPHSITGLSSRGHNIHSFLVCQRMSLIRPKIFIRFASLSTSVKRFQLRWEITV